MVMGQARDTLVAKLARFSRLAFGCVAAQRGCESASAVATAERCPARFDLKYRHKTIGTLSRDGGQWTFTYADDFDPSVMRTLAGFPEVGKVYRSPELWPFFAMRIPSMKQDRIQQVVNKEHIDAHDDAAMLKRFGRRVVSNPFELVAGKL